LLQSATQVPEFPWALAIGAGFAALCLGGAFRAARRKRLVETLPERLVARLGGLRRQPLMDIRGFEREAVAIQLQK
jgi:hypothetical protein